MKTIFFIFLLLFVSCTNRKVNNNQDLTDLTILEFDDGKEVKSSELFDSLTYIPLDSENGNCLLGEISKLEITDSAIFILDNPNDKLYKFNRSGKFLHSIGNIGQGPGEYVSIFDFVIDPYENKIVVLDRTSRKILFYNLDGDLINEVPISIMASKIAVTENMYALYTAGRDYYTKNGDLGYNLFFYDRDWNLKEKLFPYRPELDDLLHDKVFDYCVEDSSLLYHYSINDTIYRYKSNQKNDKTIIDFNKHTLPINKINKKNFIDYMNMSKYAKIVSVNHNSDYWLINYSLNNRMRIYIHNKKKNICQNINYIENDLDMTSLALFDPLTLKGNKVYLSKTAADMVLDYKQDSVSLNGIVLNNEDNPVIIIGHLK